MSQRFQFAGCQTIYTCDDCSRELEHVYEYVQIGPEEWNHGRCVDCDALLRMYPPEVLN